MRFFDPPKKASKRPSWRGRRPGPRFAREFTYKAGFPGALNTILYVNSHANRGPVRRPLQESLFDAFFGRSKNLISCEDGAKTYKKMCSKRPQIQPLKIDFVAPSSRKTHFLDPPRKGPKRLSWGRRRLGPRFAFEFTYKIVFWAPGKLVLYVNSRAKRGPGRRLLQEGLFQTFFGGSKNRILREDGAQS